MDQTTPNAGMPVQAKPVMSFDPKDIETNKLWACLSYVSFISLVMLFTKKDSKFVQEHAKQGTVLFIIQIIWWVLLKIPALWWILLPIAIVYDLAMLVLVLYAMYQTWNGKFWEIPVIGALRNQIKV
jgi:uncharacterized membrane protein